MKHFLPPLLLLFFLAQANAQGICDSVISIAPIQPMCEGTGTAYLQVSHDWGTFSGPGVDEMAHYHYLDASNLSAGTYTVKYTITGQGGCTVSATRDFVVLNATEASANYTQAIDCTNPNSSTFLFGNAGPNFNSGQWRGPSWSNIIVNASFLTTKIAGTYKYVAYPINSMGCPAYALVDVPFMNAPDTFSFKRCEDCSTSIWFKTVVNVPSNWRVVMTPPSGNSYLTTTNYCFTVTDLGLWSASMTNTQNGCVSHAAQNFPSFENIHPSINAGTDHTLACQTPFSYLNGGVAGGNDAMAGVVEPTWTTSNGHFAGSNKVWNAKIDKPGTYVLNALNVYSGCISRDTTVVHPGLTPVSSQIAFICHGDNLFGHTESGNYVDTIIQANNCPKIQKLKLFVMPPLLDTFTILPDQGQMNGSVQYEVTQGFPPFVYDWSNGETTASISNLAAGLYTVTVTDANNCQLVREIEVPLNRPGHFSSSSISTRQAPPVIRTRLYPNPAKAGASVCQITAYSTDAGEAELLLVDVLGRTLSKYSLQVQEGRNEYTLTENLTEGVYTVLIQGDFGIKEVAKWMIVAP